MKIKAELSNRHIHLCEEDFKKLFGEDYQLTCHKELKIGYTTKETITVVGEKGEISNIRILMPFRKYTQVELMYSDCVRIGLDAPCVMSGQHELMAPCKIIGPRCTLELPHAAMIAKRHVHLRQEVLDELRLNTSQVVKIKGGERSTIFEDCCVRLAEGDGESVIHIDFDEGSAAAIKNGDLMEIIK